MQSILGLAMSDRDAMPVTVTVERFKEISSLGRTSIYKLIRQGELQSACIGRRRMIVMESYLDMLKRDAERQARKRVFAVVRHRSRY